MNVNEPIISIATILTDGRRFLVVHPTNQPMWDLPKGEKDLLEDDETTARREFMEETGFDLTNIELVYKSEALLPPTMYRGEKKVRVYQALVKELPPLTVFSCSSTCRPYKRFGSMIRVPEVDDYQYITLKETMHWLRPPFFEAVRQAMQ